MRYREARTVSPDDEALLYNLARAYAAKKEKKRAVESIQKALKINPAFTEAQTLPKHLKRAAPCCVNPGEFPVLAAGARHGSAFHFAIRFHPLSGNHKAL